MPLSSDAHVVCFWEFISTLHRSPDELIELIQKENTGQAAGSASSGKKTKKKVSVDWFCG